MAQVFIGESLQEIKVRTIIINSQNPEITGEERRLWDSKNIIQELFKSYDNLSDEVKSEIPLKKVWMLNMVALGDSNPRYRRERAAS